MAGSTIGIKIADGSYYPVLKEGFTGTKRLTLTTVKDDQDRVQIDLYRGDGHTLSHAQYIGSLIIENIPPAPQGDPEIDLVLGLDAAGELTAEASDRSTGESQTFSIGIRTLGEGETYKLPEFAVETEGAADAAESDEGLDLETGGAGGRADSVDEVPLTGDTYPMSGTDRRREHLRHRTPGSRRTSPALVVLLIALGIALLACLGYLAYRLIWGPPIPALAALTSIGTTAEPAAAEPAATQPAVAATATTATTTTTTGTYTATATTTNTTATSATTSGKGVTYRIKRGDTLWDISSTYYRNPWRYPVIARANDIKNPDLIIAGTRIFIPEQ